MINVFIISSIILFFLCVVLIWLLILKKNRIDNLLNQMEVVKKNIINLGNSYDSLNEKYIEILDRALRISRIDRLKTDEVNKILEYFDNDAKIQKILKDDSIIEHPIVAIVYNNFQFLSGRFIEIEEEVEKISDITGELREIEQYSETLKNLKTKNIEE